MKFSAPDLAAALADGLAQTEISILAKAQNIDWEECVSDIRRAFFETENFSLRGNSWDQLRDRQSDYIEIFINSIYTPHTFDLAFEPAKIIEIDEDLVVIRVEDIGRALDNTIYSFEELAAAHQARDMDILDRFAEDWNMIRDARPAFATFLWQLQDDVSADDWPERLRDRLGLAHLQPRPDAIRLALMSYPVREVLAAADAVAAFTVPTVLDAKLWEHYFPAPKDIPYGRAMALSPCNTEEALVAEVLHSRLSYRGAHIRMLGEIVTPLPALPVSTLRERHLLALQVASGREDFGA